MVSNTLPLGVSCERWMCHRPEMIYRSLFTAVPELKRRAKGPTGRAAISFGLRAKPDDGETARGGRQVSRALSLLHYIVL